MQRIIQWIFLCTLVGGLSACNKTENKSTHEQIDEKPAFDIAPQRAQLQKAKELEKKMQQDAENERKVLELQTDPK